MALLASKAEDGLNDAAKAVDEAQQAIDLDPHSEPARLQLAQIFLTRNTPEAAYEIFSEALPLFPDSALIRLGAGLALNQMRRYGDAIPILKDCLKLNPDLGPPSTRSAPRTSTPANTKRSCAKRPRTREFIRTISGVLTMKRRRVSNCRWTAPGPKRCCTALSN